MDAGRYYTRRADRADRALHRRPLLAERPAAIGARRRERGARPLTPRTGARSPRGHLYARECCANTWGRHWGYLPAARLLFSGTRRVRIRRSRACRGIRWRTRACPSWRRATTRRCRPRRGPSTSTWLAPHRWFAMAMPRAPRGCFLRRSSRRLLEMPGGSSRSSRCSACSAIAGRGRRFSMRYVRGRWKAERRWRRPGRRSKAIDSSAIRWVNRACWLVLLGSQSVVRADTARAIGVANVCPGPRRTDQLTRVAVRLITTHHLRGPGRLRG